MTGKPTRQRRRWLAGAIAAAAETAAAGAPDGGLRVARPRLRMALPAERAGAKRTGADQAGPAPAGTDGCPARGAAALAAC